MTPLKTNVKIIFTFHYLTRHNLDPYYSIPIMNYKQVYQFLSHHTKENLVKKEPSTKIYHQSLVMTLIFTNKHFREQYLRAIYTRYSRSSTNQKMINQDEKIILIKWAKNFNRYHQFKITHILPQINQKNYCIKYLIIPDVKSYYFNWYKIINHLETYEAYNFVQIMQTILNRCIPDISFNFHYIKPNKSKILRLTKQTQNYIRKYELMSHQQLINSHSGYSLASKNTNQSHVLSVSSMRSNRTSAVPTSKKKTKLKSLTKSSKSNNIKFNLNLDSKSSQEPKMSASSNKALIISESSKAFTNSAPYSSNKVLKNNNLIKPIYHFNSKSTKIFTSSRSYTPKFQLQKAHIYPNFNHKTRSMNHKVSHIPTKKPLSTRQSSFQFTSNLQENYLPPINSPKTNSSQTKNSTILFIVYTIITIIIMIIMVLI